MKFFIILWCLINMTNIIKKVYKFYVKIEPLFDLYNRKFLNY